MQSLDEKTWDAVQVDNFADVMSGKDIYASERVDGERPYITAGTANNGIGYFVGNDNSSADSHVISVNRNGAVGEAFFHPYRALFGNDCRRLKVRESVGDDAQQFIAVVIKEQKDAFSYSRKLGTGRLQRLSVMLPVTDSGEPDYDYMVKYVQQKREAMLTRYRAHVEKRIAELSEVVEIPVLNEKEWAKFRAFGNEGLFDIATTGSSIDGIRIIDGDTKKIPYVTRTDSNNGIARFVSDKNLSYGSDDAGCITVGLDTQTAFWQPHLFVTGQNIQVITGPQLNEGLAQFLIPLFRKQMKAKFNWGGNGATLGRMKRLELMLPVNNDGKPDYEYMEQYSKNMMLRKYRQYLTFLQQHSGA